MDEFKQFTFIVATETLLLTLPYYFMLSYSNHGAMLLNTGKKKKNKTAVFTTGQLSRAPEIQPK